MADPQPSPGKRFLSSPDGFAFAFMAFFCLAALVLGTALAMDWSPPASRFAFIPLFFLSFALFYRVFRRSERRIFELFFYTGLWSAMPLAATQIAFAANAWMFPLRSEELLALDRRMGFDWYAWARFISSSRVYYRTTTWAYETHVWQPFVATIAIGLFGPRGRNAHLFLATMTGFSLCILIGAVVPAVGPSYFFGLESPANDALLALRGGLRSNLPYAGIVSFPSFHAVLAVLYVLAYRGMRPFLWLSILLNGLMMVSIPFSGDHYLIDVFAGFAIALIAHRIAARMVRFGDREAPEPE